MKRNFFFKDFFKDSGEIIFAQIALAIILVGAVVLIDRTFRRDNSDFIRSGNAVLSINFDGAKRTFEGETANGMTILGAFNASAAAGQIKFKYAVNKDNETELLEVDGRLNGLGNKFFKVYLNSRPVDSRDIHRIKISGGDKIELRFE